MILDVVSRMLGECLSVVHQVFDAMCALHRAYRAVEALMPDPRRLLDPAVESWATRDGAAESAQARSRREHRSSALELLQPRLDRGLAKAAIAAEPHVGDPAGPGLRANPVDPHAQAPGAFLGRQQPVDSEQLADALMWM